MTVDHKNNVDTIHCLVGTIHCLDGTIHHKLIPFIAYCIALFEVILCLRRNLTLIRTDTLRLKNLLYLTFHHHPLGSSNKIKDTKRKKIYTHTYEDTLFVKKNSIELEGILKPFESLLTRLLPFSLFFFNI